MTDETNQIDNLFDSANHELKTPLAGKRGVIIGSTLMRQSSNFGERTQWILRVAPLFDQEKPKAIPIFINCGSIRPSQDGKTASEHGKFVMSAGKPDTRSGFSKFNDYAKKAGFPIAECATSKGKGVEAFIGAEVEFKSYTSTWTDAGVKQEKGHDVIAKFHRFVEPAELAALQEKFKKETSAEGEAGGGVNVAAAPAVAAVDTAKVTETVQAAVAEVVNAQPNKELPRGQLSIKLLTNDRIKNLEPGEKTAGLALIIKDEFLAAIPGVKLDGKVLKAA